MALVTHRPSFTTLLGMETTTKKVLWQSQASLHMLVVEQELCHMLAFLSQSEQGWCAHDMVCYTDHCFYVQLLNCYGVTIVCKCSCSTVMAL